MLRLKYLAAFEIMLNLIYEDQFEQALDSRLPESYGRVLFREKCDNVFYLILDYASHGRKWAA